jgi:SAM-dependent methyltransferase
VIWACYSRLADENFFLVSEAILNAEREIAAAGLEKQTDALYPPRRFEYPWAFLQIPENSKRVLDAGGGPATFQYLLSKYVPEVYNIDINSKWIDKVENVKRVTGKFGNIVTAKGNLAEMPFVEDKTFDASLCVSVIEHGRDAEAIICELLRVTKGPVLITTDVGYGEELLNPSVLHQLGERFGFTVPEVPLDAIHRATAGGEHYKVACIRLDSHVSAA